jgi:hypothetical protein
MSIAKIQQPKAKSHWKDQDAQEGGW